MKINYVIATYDGICNRKDNFPKPENILKKHLEIIRNLDNNLTSITIMKPINNNKKYENYYNLNDILTSFNNLNFYVCENYGYSGGQWLKCYQNDPSFDYYIFTEDDYVPNMKNFDKILIDIYKNKFSDNLGVLCSNVLDGNNGNNFPKHFEGDVIVSRETLEKMYSFKQYEGNPRKFLDKMEDIDVPNFSWKELKRGYIGGYYQVSFSHLFTLSGIEHKDYLDTEINGKKIMAPYWHDNGKRKSKVFFQEKNRRIYNFSIEDIKNSLIVPIQLSSPHYIKYHTRLKVLIKNYIK